MAEAVYWVSTVTTVGLVMAVPAGVGVWLDRLWGTSPWLVILGALVGFATAMRFLLRLASPLQRQTTRPGHRSLQRTAVTLTSRLIHDLPQSTA